MISWLYSYLFARRQRVCPRGTLSNWSPVTSGVPQGSVLGPLLFNIYISDLPNCIVSRNCSYADDLKLYSPACLSTTLQNDLQHIEAWSTENGLDLNPDKCSVIHFGYNNPSHQYYIHNKIIPKCTSHPDLGILVDNSLKFHQHVDFITNKVIKKAHFILKSFSYLSVDLFSSLYKTFLRPTLEFCSQIARPCYASQMSRLKSCQRRITKWYKLVIFFIPAVSRAPISPVLKVDLNVAI